MYDAAAAVLGEDRSDRPFSDDLAAAVRLVESGFVDLAGRPASRLGRHLAADQLKSSTSRPRTPPASRVAVRLLGLLGGQHLRDPQRVDAVGELLLQTLEQVVAGHASRRPAWA